MADEFVKKEVFDARMDRMEMLVEKTLTEVKAEVSAAVSEMKTDNAQLRSEMRESNARLRGEIRVLDSRIDSVNARIEGLQTTVYWGFAIMAIVIALLPTIQSWRKIFHRSSVTLEDVERVVNAAIQQARLESR